MSGDKINRNTVYGDVYCPNVLITLEKSLVMLIFINVHVYPINTCKKGDCELIFSFVRHDSWINFA